MGRTAWGFRSAGAFLTLFFFFLLPSGLSGESWTVGMAEWRTPGLEGSSAAQVRSLSLQVYSRLTRWTEHPLTEGERTRLVRVRQSRKRWKAEKAILELKESRDRLALTNPGSGELEEAEAALQRKRRELEGGADITGDIPSEVTLEFKPYRKDRPLYPRESSSGEGLDWFFSGLAEPAAEGYCTYQLFLRSFLQEDPRLIWEDTAKPGDLPRLVEQASAAAAEVIGGRETGRFSLQAVPEESRILIDGELRGVGGVKGLLLTAETHRVRVEAPGRRGQAFHFELSPGQKLQLRLELEAEGGQRFEVVTEPAGAQVYQGGIWVGESPVVLRRLPGRGRLVRIEKEGYYPVNPPEPGTDGTSAEVGKIVLVPEEKPAEELFREKEDIFYRDLGAFMVSLAFPVVLSGASHNYEALYTDRPLEKYRQKGLFFYYSYGASLSFSGVLLAKTFFSLRDYVNTAEDYVQ